MIFVEYPVAWRWSLANPPKGWDRTIRSKYGAMARIDYDDSRYQNEELRPNDDQRERPRFPSPAMR